MNKLTDLELILVNTFNTDSRIPSEMWNELWVKVAKKFGTKIATEIYNEGCRLNEIKCPETEEDFIETYLTGNDFYE